MSALLVGILAYVFIQLLIGVWVARQVRNESDYLLAGRRLGFTVATFSIFATWFGAEAVVGSAGRVYGEGLSGGSADPFGYAACLFLMGAFFAVPLWRRGLTTLADLFKQRYSSGVERLAVLLMVPGLVLWGAAQIRAFGQVIATASEFETTIAITVAAAFAIAYTTWGGLLADAITDLLQGIVIVAGLVLILLVLVNAAGGWQASIASIPPERLQPFGGPDVSWLAVAERWAIPICGSVLTQALVARVLACRTPEIARRATLAGGGVYLAVGLIPVFIGLIGARVLPGLEHPEQLLPLAAREQLSTFFYVIFAGALVSAILSTVDSALLGAAALVSHNLVVPMHPAMTEKGKVRAARVAVAIFGLIAYVLALHAEGVYALVEEASAFGSAGIFVVAAIGLFTRRFGGPSAAYGALTAGVTAWVAGAYVWQIATPYLASLAAALLVYLAFAWRPRPGASAHNGLIT